MSAPYRIILRADSQSFQITGTDPRTGQRYRAGARADSLKLAREEAAALYADHLREAIHGPRRGVKSFAAAAALYLTADRAPGDQRRLDRIIAVIGERELGQIDQNTIDELCERLLPPKPAPATVKRGIITPVRAVMRKARTRGWCDVPVFDIPKEPKGRVRFLLPGEAARLVAAASPHLRVLIVFLLGTGARMAEALELDWREVDLGAARAIFLDTKSGAPRLAELPPAVVVALANLPHREGRVMRTHRGAPYADREREGGGQVKTAWRATLARAGLTNLRLHDLRHTWATWHYAVHKDVMRLRDEGGWSSLDLVQRYSHGTLFPSDQVPAATAFWQHGGATGGAEKVAQNWHRAIRLAEKIALSA